MLIQQKTGNIKTTEIHGRSLDRLQLEWYECNKRILHKKTSDGIEVRLKFLKENPEFAEGDILYEDTDSLIVVDIIPCDAIIILAGSLLQTASVCYEIGNRHLPLFFENSELLVPFEEPLFRLLKASGYEVRKEKRKLLNPLRSTIAPHGHSSGDSLFNRIMKLTTANE
jgi:urease accessory protein